MANAVFSSNVTYTPAGGGSLTQGFRTAFVYTASSAGTVDVAIAANSDIDIPLGSVGDVLGFVLQNNTVADIDLSVGGTSVYKIAAGGMLMHWSPIKSAKSLAALKVKPDSPAKAGTIDFVVLGN